ncbi:Hypothetical predicted protein [Marmota monax]|uniref:Uncharacterized protein n=1 Tax=Marmota monax TaxID=9995 RepID=A0A5E4C537_MARMO|nr:Hypothetical predicted protein [Marmota monax]
MASRGTTSSQQHNRTAKPRRTGNPHRPGHKLPPPQPNLRLHHLELRPKDLEEEGKRVGTSPPA